VQKCVAGWRQGWPIRDDAGMTQGCGAGRVEAGNASTRDGGCTDAAQGLVEARDGLRPGTGAQGGSAGTREGREQPAREGMAGMR
jgi:hypothetical protein